MSGLLDNPKYYNSCLSIMRRAAYKLCLLLLCFALIYNTVSIILSYRYNGIGDNVTTNPGDTSKISPLNLLSLLAPKDALSLELNMTAQDSLLPDLYERTLKSVITVVSTINNNGNATNANVQGFQASGSGFIYDNDGHILTNNHVVEGANSTYVTLSNGNSYSAFIVGRDPYSDLAVLQLDPSAIEFEHLVPLSIANSSSLRIGQHVVAIGNPLGSYSGSMTEGIVSQTNRVEPDNGFYRYGLIQFDAPITYGNSGGPLLNLDGKVVGITSGGIINATFINFAVPSNAILRIVPDLITHGSYKHSWLGISGDPVTPELAREIGLKQARGYVIEDVAPGGPADLAGIKPLSVDAGTVDIVIAIDKVPVRQQADILNYIDTKSVDDTVVLKLLRNINTVQDVSIRLAERPQSSNSSSFMANQFSRH